MRIIDSHTGGEPTRTIIEGLPPQAASASHGSMDDRKAWLENNMDWLRTSVCGEPRSSDVMVGAALVEPSDPSCDFGVIFFDNAAFIGMCGHGTMGLVVTLGWLGRIEPGVIRIDTPVGPVEAELMADRHSVRIQNIPCWRQAADVQVDIPGMGFLRGDVAWGGNGFFIIRAVEHGITVARANLQELIREGQIILQAVQAQGLGGEGWLVDHIILTSDPEPGVEADCQSMIICPGGAYDRSPCGTGTSAILACRYAENTVSPGQTWRHASIIGTCFEASFEPVNEHQIRPTITGQAWVNGDCTMIFDPSDPFLHGIPT